MNDVISPKYLMKLIKDISEAIWSEFKTYKEVKLYVDKWHRTQDDWNNYWENFAIKTKENGEIDLLSTLHGIEGETLLQIAVDIGIETPDFIPCLATFRNDIKSDYKTASATFENAFKQIESHPDIAIGLANSALESIIKEIMKDDRISTAIKKSDTLYDLASSILIQFKLFPNADLPIEIKTIGSSLLSAIQGIEKLRSTSTNFHGKSNEDYLIEDPIYTYFIVNTVSTIGLFLNTYYKRKFPPIIIEVEDDGLPF